tara:strand:+ start:306 stop:3863 length:3558 start_codon:yes stop_codon:yes gene_type:complete
MEPKLYDVSQETSNVIHRLFDGDIQKLTKESVKDVYNDPTHYEFVTESVVKELLKIIRYRDDSSKDYRILLQDSTFQEEPKEIEDDEDDEEDEVEDITNYVLPQRKAYVKFINEMLMPRIIQAKESDEVLKIYQRFVKDYLSLSTPYRGLLVYHGLGTGKSATAISTAEGLSNSLSITTLLPASLETEFIKEIKLWGDSFYKVDTNNWVFYPLKEIQSDLKLRKQINGRFKFTIDRIKRVSTRARRKTMDKSLDTGFWMPITETTHSKPIYTVPNGLQSFVRDQGKETSIECESLIESQIEHIQLQITETIRQTYQFIHYNPLPKLTVEKKASYTDNEKLSIRLLKELEKNKKQSIQSPFNEQVIIIDEVHNFVREIYNNSGPSRQYYEWIVNSENVKLVFLSGTPLINRPSEIAILCNMLKGVIKTYTVTVQQSVDNSTIDETLKQAFYADDSPVEQVYSQKREGKLVISFIQNKPKFESLVDPETGIVYTYKHGRHTFDQFIEFIYDTLESMFQGTLVPNRTQIKKHKNDILKGITQIFDTQINIPFNVNQKLFEIYKRDGTVIDLTDNENFMDYFFETDTNQIKLSKRILLKRMLMGLISYYPIDRSAIKIMPEITKPRNTLYSESPLAQKINLVSCVTSSKQFSKYEESWKESKVKSMKQSLYGDVNQESFDYYIRTRQACNMVYENDKFRSVKSNAENQLVIQEMKQMEYSLMKEAGVLQYDKGLKMVSPKFYEIMKRIEDYVNADGIPTGKILYYSEFRSDAGSEIFEQVLLSNGYQKYDGSTETKGKRYTFITGSEDEIERKRNKEAFNDVSNKLGDEIQIMIISGAGAEGISLTCVRQVHIMEPYWNYVRIDQVFGRAIRLGSHLDLPLKERTVEQYMYLSVFPEGTSIREVYLSLKDTGTWAVPQLDESEDIVNLLYTNHKDVYQNIQKIIKLKADTQNKTADQLLFQTMENKYTISQEMIQVIQESSVDCIQNSRDNIVLNEACIRFDDKVQGEMAYFPGIDASQLQTIDTKQLTAEFMYFIKPSTYVIGTDKQTFAYYFMKDKDTKDIRYIREKGSLMGILNPFLSLYSSYEFSSSDLESKLGTQFSLFQYLYKVSDSQMTSIQTTQIFPKPESIDHLLGYKIKHNTSELFFYLPNDNRPILRLYEYDICEQTGFVVDGFTPLIFQDDQLYRRV